MCSAGGSGQLGVASGRWIGAWIFQIDAGGLE